MATNLVQITFTIFKYIKILKLLVISFLFSHQCQKFQTLSTL